MRLKSPLNVPREATLESFDALNRGAGRRLQAPQASSRPFIRVKLNCVSLYHTRLGRLIQTTSPGGKREREINSLWNKNGVGFEQ